MDMSTESGMQKGKEKSNGSPDEERRPWGVPEGSYTTQTDFAGSSYTNQTDGEENWVLLTHSQKWEGERYIDDWIWRRTKGWVGNYQGKGNDCY